MECAFDVLTDSIHQKTANVASVLSNATMKLKGVLSENSEWYRKELTPLIESMEWEGRSVEDCQYWQSKLQKIVDMVNEFAKDTKKRKFVEMDFFIILLINIMNIKSQK